MAIKVTKAVDFPGEAQVTLIGLPNKVTTDVKKITKDTDRPGLPHQDRQGLAGRQPHEPVLPGGGDAERRADRAQPRQRHAPDRRAAAAQAERPGPRPAPVAAAPKPAAAPPAKPLTRLEKLRLESQAGQGRGQVERSSAGHGR